SPKASPIDRPSRARRARSLRDVGELDCIIWKSILSQDEVASIYDTAPRDCWSSLRTSGGDRTGDSKPLLAATVPIGRRSLRRLSVARFGKLAACPTIWRAHQERNGRSKVSRTGTRRT